MSKSSFDRSRIWLAAGCLGLVALWIVADGVLESRKYASDPETLAAGAQLFKHKWTPNDPLAAGGDGLGPVFNAASCADCHFQGGIGGGGSNKHNVVSFDVLPTRYFPNMRQGVVHAFAISDALRESRKTVRQKFPLVKNGKRVITGCTETREDLDPVRYQVVNTTALFGAGLIEKIPDRSIRFNATRRTFKRVVRELNADFTVAAVGRARYLKGSGLGKFGWKAQFASLEDFVAAACALEIGLTNPMRAQDYPRQHTCDSEAQLDLDAHQFRALVSYVANLPAPRQVLPGDPHAQRIVDRGELLFAQVGCADCHSPDLGGVAGIYSDLRLHVITREDGDPAYVTIVPEVPIPGDHPQAGEWKTPPLWGVADSAPYFHDGGSLTLESAILRHGGEAGGTRKKFRALDAKDQRAVVAFLKTLRAPGAATQIASK